MKVLTPGYYARHDTKTPMRYAMISIAINLVLNLALILPLKHVGPPLATALASTVNVWMLYHTLKKRGHFETDARLRRRVPAPGARRDPHGRRALFRRAAGRTLSDGLDLQPRSAA